MTSLPLPEPDGWAGKDWYHRPATTLADISKFKLEQARYTADQMHAYYDAGYRAGLEAAAKVCEETWPEMHKYWGPGQARAACDDCAAGIRALEVSHD